MAVLVFYNPSNPSEYVCVAGAFIESPRDERRHPGESLQQSNPTQVLITEFWEMITKIPDRLSATRK